MKTIKIELLEKGDKNSIGYISKALKEIREKPKSHGYSEKEVERLLKIESDLIESFKPFEEKLNSFGRLMKEVDEAFKKFRDSFGSVISQFQNLAKTGWFISPDVIHDYKLDKLLELSHNPSIEKTDRIMLDRHSSNSEINSILKSLSSSFPNRDSIFSEISKCYELGLYSAVVTLAYTQADGICNEIWKYGFFDKDKSNLYKPKLYLELENIDLGFSSHFVNQLGVSENEITRHSKDEYFEKPGVKEKSSNRHLVIHGHSVEYGTQVNALKAIFLLNFLEHFVEEYKS